MAVATMQQFFGFKRHLLLGLHDFGTHVYKLALSNVLPNTAAADQLADITQIAAGTGYTAGGATVTTSLPAAGITPIPVIMGGLTFTATGVMGPFQYVVLYNDTAAGDLLVGLWDIGVAVTLQSADTFKVTPDPLAGIFTLG